MSKYTPYLISFILLLDLLVLTSGVEISLDEETTTEDEAAVLQLFLTPRRYRKCSEGYKLGPGNKCWKVFG